MSQRTILWTAAVLLVVPAALAAPVPATTGGDDTVPPAAAKLLRFRKVQKELMMTAEQRIALVDALEDIDENYEKEITRILKLPNAPDEALDKADQNRRKAIEKLMTETAAKSLSAGQRTRLRQIDWQLRGPAAFTEARVEKALQLTDDQKKAAAALAERQQQMAEQYLDQIGSDTEEKLKADLFAFRKEATMKFVTSLKPDQRDAWKAMLGEPVKGFDVHELWLQVIEEEDLISGHPSL